MAKEGKAYQSIMDSPDRAKLEELYRRLMEQTVTGKFEWVWQMARGHYEWEGASGGGIWLNEQGIVILDPSYCEWGRFAHPYAIPNDLFSAATRRRSEAVAAVVDAILADLAEA